MWAVRQGGGVGEYEGVCWCIRKESLVSCQLVHTLTGDEELLLGTLALSPEELQQPVQLLCCLLPANAGQTDICPNT